MDRNKRKAITRMANRLIQAATGWTATGQAPKWRAVLQTTGGDAASLYRTETMEIKSGLRMSCDVRNVISHTSNPERAELYSTDAAAALTLPDAWIWELANMRKAKVYRFEYENDSKATQGTIRAESMWQAIQALKLSIGHPWGRSMARTMAEDNHQSVTAYTASGNLSKSDKRLHGWTCQPSLMVTATPYTVASNIQSGHVMTHAADIIKGTLSPVWVFEDQRPGEVIPSRPSVDPIT